MITVKIDELTPCLKDCETGELVHTEVVRVKRKSVLKKYRKSNGWYIDWDVLLDDDNEVYALVVEGTIDIQGLVAIKNDRDLNAVFIYWMVANPLNQKSKSGYQKYVGVGGHLFAIAIQKSLDYGYDGCVFGFAMNKKLLEHYIKTFDAEFLGTLHPYHFMIDEIPARKILEVYTYDLVEERI